ncbi:hypothetical protein ACQ86N_37385 [Puia sp. P3]|uniref:hypothetical protein n=1 Tax=Puia sp. P3 TaxID=3423952 RepID=UPI003D67C73A
MAIPAGDSVQIIIRTNNSDPTERYYFDNVKLTGVSGVNALATAGGSLTCTAGSVTLLGSSTTAGAVYSWTGPGGFNSLVQNPSVAAPGIYTLTVTAGDVPRRIRPWWCRILRGRWVLRRRRYL